MNNNNEQQVRVATYARVSTQEQATENTSLESQAAQLIAYCRMRDWTIINSYVDPGFTGKNGDRPGLKQLRADAKIGLFDKVLVCKLDRLARNLSLLMSIESELKEFHVTLNSIKESVDTSNGTGKWYSSCSAWSRNGSAKPLLRGPKAAVFRGTDKVAGQVADLLSVTVMTKHHGN